jgi:release factor glutamine methyltransferase
MKTGGKIYFEINERLGNQVVNLLDNLGYQNPRIIKDLHGKDRMVTARYIG